MPSRTFRQAVSELAEFLNNQSERLGRRDLGDAEETLRVLTKAGVNGTAIGTALARLVKGFNTLGLPSIWVASAVNRKLATLKIGQKGWIFTPKFRNLRNSRERLYSLILAACVDGSLSCLRQCQACKRFFIPDYQTTKNCSPACSKASYRQGAVERVRNSRRRNADKEKETKKLGKVQVRSRREEKQQRSEDREAAAIKEFGCFLKNAELPKPENDEIWSSRFRKIPEMPGRSRWTVINEWISAKKNGEVIESIWRRAPKNFRESCKPTALMGIPD